MVTYDHVGERPSALRGDLQRGHRAFLLFLLAVFASTLTLRTGQLGFMPLDQSIIFDGGWRIYAGQTPLVDFFSPTGLLPSFIQAGMFNVMGVTWWSYVVHAAALNVMFAIFVYALLRRLFGWNWLSLYSALLAAYFMYPPMGTPYMDQHALFFSFVMLGLFLCGVRSEAEKDRILLWFLMPIAGALAFHSKQNPSGFAIVFVSAAALFFTARDPLRYRRAFLAALAGLGFVVAAVLLMFAILGISPGNYFYWLIELPLLHGSDRLSGSWERIVVVFVMWTLCAVPVSIGVRFAVSLDPSAMQRSESLALVYVTAALLSLAAIYSATTLNAPIFAFAYYAPALALAYGLLSRRLPEASTESRRILSAFQGLFLALGFMAPLLSATPVSLRWPNEFQANETTETLPAEYVHPALHGLRWSLPDRIAEHGNEFRADRYRALVSYLERDSRNFFLLGDASILYALSGRPSVFPSLWIHEGLSFPARHDDRRADFERKLVAALIRYDVRLVVRDGPRTFTGTEAGDFAVLERCLSKDEEAKVMIGRFAVIPLSQSCVRSLNRGQLSELPASGGASGESLLFR